MDKERI